MSPVRFEPRITTGDLLHFVLLLIAGTIAWANHDGRIGELERQRATDARISVAENNIQINRELISDSIRRTEASQREIKDAILRIEQKIDKVR
jgi:hypothetical protein